MTEFAASHEAQRSWSRASALLRIYYHEGLAGLAGRRWREELGVRVDGIPSDPTDLLLYVITADQAMQALRLVNRKAYLLMQHLIEHPGDRWVNERGTGVAQVLDLSTQEAKALYAAGVEYVFWLMGDGEAEVAVDVRKVLENS